MGIGEFTAIFAAATCLSPRVVQETNPPATQRIGNFAVPPELDGHFGFALAAGDIDGDRFDDLVISARTVKDGIDQVGKVYVFRGPRLGLLEVLQRDHGDLPPFSDLFGHDVLVHDLNQDGYGDLVVEYAWPGEGGWARVYWGPDLDRFLELNLAGGSFQYGLQTLAAGDLDGDGRPNLAVCTHGAEGILVFDPRPGHPDPILRVGPESGAQSLTLGDLDDDGALDLAIGYPHATVDGKRLGGRVWVMWGPRFEDGVQLTHPMVEESVRFGHQLASGDWNQDGCADLAISTRGRKCEGQGHERDLCFECFVFMGPELTEHDHLLAPGDDLSYAAFGYWCTFPRGFPDFPLAVSAPSAFAEEIFAGAFCLVDRDPAPRWPLYSDPTPQQNAWFGRKILAADLNADGRDEIVAAAPFARNANAELVSNGEVWVHDFSTTTSWTPYGIPFPDDEPPAIEGMGEISAGSEVRVLIEGLRDSTLAVLCCAFEPDSIPFGACPGPPYLLLHDPSWIVPATFDDQGHVELEFQIPFEFSPPGTRCYLQAFVDAPSRNPSYGHTRGLIATAQPTG